MTEQELLTLARDRKLKSPEIHDVNAYYGHASIIKNFLGIHPDYALKTMLEHAPGVEYYIWDAEADSPLPYMFCSTGLYARYFNEQLAGKKTAFPIGHYLNYLPLPAPPEPDGTKRLLIFPKHSTHHNHVQYDAGRYVRELYGIARDFDEVTVCVYWKDVLMGRHEAYMKAGFDCVTAGHMYDDQFLHRLVRIIAPADMVISGFPGTDVCYSVLMGKPVWIRQTDSHLTYSSEYFEKMHKNIIDAKNIKRETLPTLFAEPSMELNKDQTDFVNAVCGSEFAMSREAMLDIVQAAELRFCKAHGLPFGGVPLVGEG